MIVDLLPVWIKLAESLSTTTRLPRKQMLVLSRQVSFVLVLSLFIIWGRALAGLYSILYVEIRKYVICFLELLAKYCDHLLKKSSKNPEEAELEDTLNQVVSNK